MNHEIVDIFNMSNIFDGPVLSASVINPFK